MMTDHENERHDYDDDDDHDDDDDFMIVEEEDYNHSTDESWKQNNSNEWNRRLDDVIDDGSSNSRVDGNGKDGNDDGRRGNNVLRSQPRIAATLPPPEIMSSDKQKIPPRRRARPPLPSPTRKVVETTTTRSRRTETETEADSNNKKKKNTKSQSSSSQKREMSSQTDPEEEEEQRKVIDRYRGHGHGRDRDHNERLDYLALTVEEILSSNKKNSNKESNDKNFMANMKNVINGGNIGLDDDDDDGDENDDDSNDDHEDDSDSRRKALLQKFSMEFADDDDFDIEFSSEGTGSGSSIISSEDDETIALLRKAKDENQYETAAAEIIEKIQQQQQQQKKNQDVSSQQQQQQQQQLQEQQSQDGSFSPEARVRDSDDNKDTYDIDIDTSNEFEAQRRRRLQQEEQNDQDLMNLRDSLPSLEEENEEIIQLLARARHDGSMATPLFDEDDDDHQGIQSKSKNGQYDNGDDGTWDRRQKRRRQAKLADDNVNDYSSSTGQFVTNYERSGDGSVFLSPDAYMRACEGSTTNPDGSLNFATLGDNNRNSKHGNQRRRRNVKVSPETISSEMDGPMAPYDDSTSEEEMQKMIDSETSGDYGEADVTLEEVMETYKNLDRSLVDVVVGWKDPSHLETTGSSRATSPTPEEEEKFRRLLSEADEIEDRAFQERQAADPQDLYRKQYEDEINELDQMLDQIHDELGLDDTAMDSPSRKDGVPDGKDSTSFDADIVDGDGEDVDGIFFSSTSAGKELEEMIKKSRIDHQDFVNRYYATKQESEDEWDSYADNENVEATEE